MTTPLSPLPASYAGAAPSGLVCWSPGSSRRLWLGKPGAMFELPSPSSSNLTSPRSKGEVAQQLASGATTTVFIGNATRAFSYTWPALGDRDYELLRMFHDRAPVAAGGPGNGPWCLLEPEGRNRLTRAQSMCGALTGVVQGWAVTGTGTVVPSTAVAAPVTPCGVMLWTPSAATKQLVAGSVVSGTPVPDASFGAPNVPAEFVAFSVQARTASGTAQVSARLIGCNADGSGAVPVTGPTATVSSTQWAQVSVIAGPGAWSTPSVVPTVVSVDGHAVYLSNPQLSYTQSTVEWAPGGGVPRVVLAPGLNRDLTRSLRSGATWTLTEAVAGAA